MVSATPIHIPLSVLRAFALFTTRSCFSDVSLWPLGALPALGSSVGRGWVTEEKEAAKERLSGRSGKWTPLVEVFLCKFRT